jgi:hypothetical protein
MFFKLWVRAPRISILSITVSVACDQQGDGTTGG